MSTLIERLAHDRHAQRYQAATSGHPLASDGNRSADATLLESARTRAGWLLVGLGLRLAMRGGDAPARRASLLGR